MQDGNTGNNRQAVGFPPLFVPPCTEPAWWERGVWFLTAAGRARYRLWQAWQMGPCQNARTLVASACDQLGMNAAQDRKLAPVLRELLFFLAWSSVEDSAVEEARRWLAALDVSFPATPERLSLRWQFMQRCLERHLLAAYAEQAVLFLNDQLLDLTEHSPAVLAVVRVLFERDGPEGCARVLVSVRKDVQQYPPVRMALMVCRCPARFQSREEADQCGSSIEPGLLDFAPLLCSRGWLVLARAAEWSSDWNSMAEYAQKAVTLTPEDDLTRYWARRAALHLSSTPAATEGDDEPTPDTPDWQRLRRLWRLKITPTFESVEGMLPVLAGELGAPDHLEHELTLQLVEGSLTNDQARTPTRLSRCAELSQAVEHMVGLRPRLQVNLALKEIKLDQDYAGAARRLEASPTASAPEAPVLARIARLLAGTPRQAAHPIESDCLSALESALHRLADPPPDAKSIPNDAVLLATLQTVENDALCDEFPVLRSISRVLQCALQAATGSQEGGNESRLVSLPDRAPTWLTWLAGRVRHLRRGCTEAQKILDGCVVVDFENAWCWQGWWYHYGPAMPLLPELVRRANTIIDDRVRATEPRLQATFQTIIALRQLRSSATTCPNMEAQELVGAMCLGDLFGYVFAFEIALELELAEARRALQNGNAEVAFHRLTELDSDLEKHCLLTRTWWRPVVRYWVGVAAATAGRPEALEALNSLIDGPKGVEARAQLALLAVRHNDLPTAGRWLTDLPVLSPSVLYAQALLASREGRLAEAKQMLDSYDVRFADLASPYRLACRRLAAALLERTGQFADAEATNRAVLQENAHDAVAAARLARLQLHKAYMGGNLGSVSAPEESQLTVTLEASAGIKWVAPYRALHRLLVGSGPALDEAWCEAQEYAQHTTSLFAWRQVYANRLLREHRAREAWALDNSATVATAPVWYRRTRLLLRAWAGLCDSGRAAWVEKRRSSSDEPVLPTPAAISPIPSVEWLADWRRELDGLVGGEDNLIAQRWSVLLARAIELAGASKSPAESAIWTELAPWPFAFIPGLWSGDSATRQQAATQLAFELESSDGHWASRERNCLQAVVAYTLGRDEALVAHYANLEPGLDELPIPGVALWLAAASIQFRRKEWKQLLDSPLPQCVADLTEPGVRLVIGLSYAQVAAEESLKGENRAALQKLQQARSTLRELAEMLAS